jgi:cell shape-determining protein MreC
LVQLPGSTGAKVPVVVKRPNALGVQARGLLVSQGGQLLLDKVLQTEDIMKGDLVVSSGEQDFPADLVIGQISDVFGKSAELYQKARVQPLLDYRNLTVVFIVIR